MKFKICCILLRTDVKLFMKNLEKLNFVVNLAKIRCIFQA